jgi:hypothetical protein
MQAQGMPDLMIATMVFPKRMQLIKRGRPTLTEQAVYARDMAKRAEERLRGQMESQAAEPATPPDPLLNPQQTATDGAAPLEPLEPPLPQ